MGDTSTAPSPDGKFLFAGVAGNTTVVSYGIGTEGSLTELSSVTVMAPPAGMKVSADGKYLAVSLPNFGVFGAVAMFSIASDGTLTMINAHRYRARDPRAISPMWISTALEVMCLREP